MTNSAAAIVSSVVLLTNQVVNLHPSGEQKEVVTTELAIVSTAIVYTNQPVLLVTTNVLRSTTNVYTWQPPPKPPMPPMPQLFQNRKLPHLQAVPPDNKQKTNE